MAVTTSKATLDAYEKRDQSLRARALKEFGGQTLDDEQYVEWLVGAIAPIVKPSSWRVYRLAAEHGLAQKPETSSALIERLKSTLAGKRRSIKTSATKAKRLTERDFQLIVAAAIATGSLHARALALFLDASRATGLRPVEWRAARIEEREPGVWALTVRCAKRNEQRAHSARRTLLFDQSAAALKKTIERWLAIVAEAKSDGDYGRLLGTLRSLMWRTTKNIFPRRMRRPTLYSARHEAAARFKAHYIEGFSDPEKRLHGAAIVAALLGHSSDITASAHYGKPRRDEKSSKWPIPRADPEEVARVKPRLAEQWKKFDVMRAERADAEEVTTKSLCP